MDFELRKADISDLVLLTETRITVLRAANRLDESEGAEMKLCRREI